MLRRTLGSGLTRVGSLRLGKRFEAATGELGLMQRWYASQPIQRVVVVVLELAEGPSVHAVEAAVRQLCARSPDALGICEVRSPQRLAMRPLTAADPLPWFSPPDAAKDAWTLATTLVHLPFNRGAPLFRVALDNEARCVVCAFDHVVADGVSVGLFATDLARLLSGRSLAAPLDADARVLDARLDLRPSLSQLARAVIGRGANGILRAPKHGAELKHDGAPKHGAALQQDGAQSDVFAPSALRTRVLHHAVETTQLNRLRARAHERGLTLHAALSAAAVLAAAQALDADRDKLRLHTPISLRGRCHPEPLGMGVFIAGVDTDVVPSDHGDLWSVARHCRDSLARNRPSAPGQLGLLRFAGDLTAFARKLDAEAHGRTATVEVSNVGRLELPRGDAVWATQGAHYHSALFVLTLAENDGALRCCLSVPQPLVDDARAERFMRALRRLLDDPDR